MNTEYGAQQKEQQPQIFANVLTKAFIKKTKQNKTKKKLDILDNTNTELWTMNTP